VFSEPRLGLHSFLFPINIYVFYHACYIPYSCHQPQFDHYTDSGLDGRGFEIRVPEEYNIIFSKSCRPVLGPIQHPIQRVPGPLSPGIKQASRKADHSTASTEVKQLLSIHPLTHTSSWRSASLVKHKVNFP
jgi:hypothetical protein